MLGPGEAERLQALDWGGKEEELVGRQSRMTLRMGGRSHPVLARRTDGACVYLGARNQCLIHEHFGPEVKPLMCQLFPFALTPIGGQLGVDVSFACRAVSEGRGERLSVRTSEWTRLVAAGEIESATEHRFSQKYRISGELLWELENHLLDLLGGGTLALRERLRVVQEFARLALTSDPRTDNARLLRQAMAKGIPAQIRSRPAAGGMDETQRAVFFQLLYLMLNPIPLDFHARSHHAQQKEKTRRIAAAESYRSTEAHPWLDDRELGCSFGSVDEVEPGFLVASGGEQWGETYLKAKIVGQRHLKEGVQALAFVEAIPRLLLLYPFWIWTAKALAAERKADSVSEEDARAALRLVDRAFGQISLRELPKKQKKAWSFVLLETSLAECATYELLGPE
jgi:Fe-S-cluster containining protein